MMELAMTIEFPQVSLRVKVKGSSLEEFVAIHGSDLAQDGFMVRTPRPLAVGTGLSFAVQLDNDETLLAGEGTVVWVKAAVSVGGIAGMGVRFDQLNDISRAKLKRALALLPGLEASPAHAPLPRLSAGAIPVTINLPWAGSIDELAAQMGAEIGPRDLFVRTEKALPVGSSVRLQVLLADGSTALAGAGTVGLCLKGDEAAGIASGVSIRFDVLDQQSQVNLAAILARSGRSLIAPELASGAERDAAPSGGLAVADEQELTLRKSPPADADLEVTLREPPPEAPEVQQSSGARELPALEALAAAPESATAAAGHGTTLAGTARKVSASAPAEDEPGALGLWVALFVLLVLLGAASYYFFVR
jgi:uncharacterized protein (TIGR02266 family)